MSALLTRGGWFERTYRDGLTAGKRYHTFKAALTLLHQLAPVSPRIVETGCQRDREEWGAGCSTTVLGSWCAKTGGVLHSVDLSEDHVRRCARIMNEAHLEDYVYLHQRDSVSWLSESVYGSQSAIRWDMLYLDSFDYPYGTILEAYGGKADIEQARRIVEGMTDADILDRHGSVVAECQEHCLREIQVAAPSLRPGSVVLIDDVLPGGGKPRLAAEWMKLQGWQHVIEDYQTLWVVR